MSGHLEWVVRACDGTLSLGRSGVTNVSEWISSFDGLLFN